MVELLAPAGSREALVAAVENGANAIYLAGNAFGARAYASNFDREALREAIHATGYEVKSVTSAPYEKHGLFGFLKK